MAITVTLLGVGEAFDAEEPNSSALVQSGGFTLLIDCGHSAVAPLWRRLPDPNVIDAIFLSHHHADHVLGLIPVLDRWNSERRQKPLAILTSESGIGQLTRQFEAGFIPLDSRSAFPIHLQRAEDHRRIGPFEARVAPTSHAVPNFAIRLEAAGRRFAYSGDGRPTDASRALYSDVHLLMHECFMPGAADELPYHCDFPTVCTIAGPERIGLYHVKAGQRDALRRRVAADARFFVPESGAELDV